MAADAATARPAQGSLRQGLTQNTRAPWEAPQGTLVPCVTHPASFG
jgi:hypothetical protein